MLRDLRQKLFSGDDLRLLDKLLGFWSARAIMMTGRDVAAGKEYIGQEDFRAGFERFGISYSVKDWLDFEIHFEDPDDADRLDFRLCSSTILGELPSQRQQKCDVAKKRLKRGHAIPLSALMWCLRDTPFVTKTERYFEWVHGVTAEDDEAYAGAIDNVEGGGGRKAVSPEVLKKVKRYVDTGTLKGEYSGLRKGLPKKKKKKKKRRSDDSDDDSDDDDDDEEEEEKDEEPMSKAELKKATASLTKKTKAALEKKAVSTPKVQAAGKKQKGGVVAVNGGGDDDEGLGSPGQQATRGVVYLGHIPFGFFEDQMKGFFAQFGDVSRLRLARNRKTGKSK
jgi:hypothetical protein